MNDCNYIKKRIDEAEKPDLFSFEVTEHIGRCEDCERFAAERTALRKLVAAGTRVSAPVNFDAMLKARLAEVKSRRSFWPLGSPGYLRLGAATAGLLFMIFAAQFAGLLTNKNVTPTNGSQSSNVAPNPTAIPLEAAPPSTPPNIGSQLPAPAVVAGAREYRAAAYAPRMRRGDVAVGSAVPVGYMTAEDGGVVLVRGRNGDMDVQVPTVSVGAQPLLYVGAGHRTVRNVGTSF